MAKGNTNLVLKTELGKGKEKDGDSGMCLFQTTQPRGEH